MQAPCSKPHKAPPCSPYLQPRFLRPDLRTLFPGDALCKRPAEHKHCGSDTSGEGGSTLSALPGTQGAREHIPGSAPLSPPHLHPLPHPHNPSQQPPTAPSSHEAFSSPANQPQHLAGLDTQSLSHPPFKGTGERLTAWGKANPAAPPSPSELGSSSVHKTVMLKISVLMGKNSID